MADLFLDTAYLEIAEAERVAQRVRDCGFAPLELRQIFEDEVGPAFSFNLLDIAGEWGGWDTQFVRDRIVTIMSKRRARAAGRLQYWLVGRAVYRDWLKVEGVLNSF